MENLEATNSNRCSVPFHLVPGYSKWVCRQTCPKQPPSLSNVLSAAKRGGEEAVRGKLGKARDKDKEDFVPGFVDRSPRTDKEISISDMPVYAEDDDHGPDSHSSPIRPGTLDFSNIRWLPGKWWL